MPSRRQRIARRRRVVALIALVATGGLAALAWSGLRPEPLPARDEHRPDPDVATPPAGRSAAVPAWTAWVPGGFEPGFRAAARGLAGFERVVVVAGDTLWLSKTRDADGRVVDRPRPPYRYAIDAFAVAPGEYAPFLTRSAREPVLAALRRGQAVLGASSAALRRLEAGGVLVFGRTSVRVGAVVPDDAVGWSEALVSRRVGRQLGIVHDRYLLGIGGDPSLSERAVAARVGGLLPPGVPIRVEAPGATPYARVASGVRPPIVFKQIFGEFAAAPNPANPAQLTIDPAWVEANIVTRRVPLLGTVTCHRKLFPQLVAALTDLQARGLGHLVDVYSGCWVARTVARSPTAPPSYHAYGAAIDINAPTNPYGAPPTQDPRLVAAFERQGFTWGGDFLIPDGHHFEYWGPPGDRPPG
jgi:hypothetical protein